MIDEGVGRCFRPRSARSRRTPRFVFTSDHGDMFGDHGMMLKGGMHYEGCMRVPLLIARPRTARACDVDGGLGRHRPHAARTRRRARVPRHAGHEPRAAARRQSRPACATTSWSRRTSSSTSRRRSPPADADPDHRGRSVDPLFGQRAGRVFRPAERSPELENQYDRGVPGLQHELTDRLARRLMETDDRAPKPQTLA